MSNFSVTNKQLLQIKTDPYLKSSQYGKLDINKTLEYYYKRFVIQLNDYTSSNSIKIIDLGTGFGWLPIAFAIFTGAKIFALEPNQERIKSAIKFAKILGVNDKINWIIGEVGELPVRSNKFDVVYCIEVIEHTYRRQNVIVEINRISKDLLIITTPNLWFPIIAHDTSLPLCHWLPIPLRKIYARIFNRLDRENDNLFWSPIKLNRGLKEFVRVSKFLHYKSYKKFLDTFPIYLPYGSFKFQKELSTFRKIYFGLVSKNSKLCFYLLPNLASVYKRKIVND